MKASPGLSVAWSIAAQEATAGRLELIEPEHVLGGLLKFAELDARAMEALGRLGSAAALVEEQEALQHALVARAIQVPQRSTFLRRRLRDLLGRGSHEPSPNEAIHRAPATRAVSERAAAAALALGQQQVDCLLLLEVLLDPPTALVRQALQDMGIPAPEASPEAPPEEGPRSTGGRPASLSHLTSRLRSLRAKLMEKIFGQGHAIHAFIEGLYEAEVVAVADTDRKRPQAVFVFAGPPGVGKTLTAELAASLLGRPFRRFDMTGYTDSQQHNQLVGFAPSYKGAQPGALTGFVRQHPRAILLFDEIEKAHLNVIQLFYQVLDGGHLEDKFSSEEISFRDTLLIFTTNAGRSLYDHPNRSGLSAASSSFSRRTILSALENEKNPTTGAPAFPPAICSRLGQGYPLMFNHLGVNELERVCEAALEKTETLLGRQYARTFEHDPLVPMALVLREGQADARQLAAQAEKLLKTELFRFCSLYSEARLDEVFADIDTVSLGLEDGLASLPADIQALFASSARPEILLVGDPGFAEFVSRHVNVVNWHRAYSVEETVDVLSTRDVSMVLLDLWVQRPAPPSEALASTPSQAPDTVHQGQDFVPLGARALEEGRAILRKIHERFPDVPTWLLSFGAPPAGAAQHAALPGEGDVPTIHFDTWRCDDLEEAFGTDYAARMVDDELFQACVRAGGARGILATGLVGPQVPHLVRACQEFAQSLLQITRRLYRETQAAALARERKHVTFDTVARVDRERRRVHLQMRDFRLARAIDAQDAGSLVDDVSRPSTRFSDVIGASAAKESLSFLVEWLRNPKAYRALGVRPPRGILLTGPPGTGKTMLARAVAGETNCAFLEASAAGFVTMWQGSGPQGVRDLFSRARRYAPAIVFIDEIDAVGKKRVGARGAGQAEETTLNALLTEMDGFGAPASAPVMVLAATNLGDHLDPALRRRFDREIEVDRPDRAARRQFLVAALDKRASSRVSPEVIDRLAGQSAGMTVADLERVLHEAVVMASRTPGAGLTDALLEEAFERARMGEARAAPDPETLLRVSRHEAGHALIAWLGGHPPVQVTIVGRGSAGGYMEREAEEEKILYTRDELLHRIREAMGGRAAEILYYGDQGGLSTGVAGDLEHATATARQMVGRYGMCPEVGLIHLGPRKTDDGPLALEASRAVERLLREQLDAALALLRAHQPSLDRLSHGLFEKNRLTRPELALILPPLPEPAP